MIRTLPITMDCEQEELYDVGAILFYAEKDGVPEIAEQLRQSYKPWFLQLALPYFKNPVVVVRAIWESWSEYRIAQELGVSIPGLPQE